ncbi:disulfide bond formation protein B [Pseudosulfitobacter sp. SM2401]|uniref:disulfide bond formation protein B n=1 Tax=Pseudosulfitobacter sp. SM2401 TaxID=3350098 RepID=UPI0036F26A83
MNSKRTWILIAAGGSLALMLGALAFQHIGGLAPCKLCITQRYPHVIAIVIGVIALAIPRVPVILLGAVAAAITAGYGFYHAGVERGIFEGPTSCTSNSISDLSADELLDQIMSAPLIRCDDIPWEMLGLSMAGWNAVISTGLFAAWLIAATRKA